MHSFRLIACIVLALSVTACASGGAPPFLPTLGAPQPGHHGITARFFGVSTVLLTDNNNKLLVDGFFSRPHWSRLGPGMKPDAERIEDAVRDGGMRPLDLLLVAHSHYDHAMDVGLVAKTTGALVVGSESTAAIARGEHVGHVHVIDKDGPVPAAGEFKVMPFAMHHAPTPLPLRGHMREPPGPLASALTYLEGGNYGFLVTHRTGNVLIVPSADEHSKPPEKTQVDVVLLGIGGLGKQTPQYIQNYWDSFVVQTCARLVVPIHWDDFTKPLRHPLQPMPRPLDDMNASIAELRRLAQAHKVELAYMPVVQAVQLTPISAQRRAAPCPSGK